MRAIVFTGAGGAEVMRLEARPDPVPGPDEVLVAATHAGLNPADVHQRAGHYPAPPGAPADVPGLEVAGTVIARGGRVTQWREGDRVFGIVGGGGLADRVVVHERHVAPVPGRLGEAEAAAVPEAFVTAHDALFTQAGLGLGMTVLVNGASGGVGTAAVQLGVACGARVIASARSHLDRLAELGAEPGPAAGHVDVVLELIGGPNLESDLDSLAVGGRIVVVGVGGGSAATLALGKLMSRRAAIRGTVLRALPLEQKAAAVQGFSRAVVPLLAAGRVRPIVDRVFPAEEAAAAFDYLQWPGKFGKVLLAFG